jgi:hypothetical protein
MSKRNERSLVSTSHTKRILLFGALAILVSGLTGCDRGASVQQQAAQRFADAVSRSDVNQRDSMIATFKFKEYFSNAYVCEDMISWFRTFYDFQNRSFIKPPRADVDRDLRKELAGALIDPAPIEETGIVQVPSPTAGEDAAFFWMVKQTGKHWRVAIVTKGEALVDFH